MTRDTAIGGPQRRFPATRQTLLRAVADADPAVRERAFGALVAAYWKPVYKCLRLKWRLANEDAKDATQGFFASLLDGETLRRFDPARARFRTYLRVCLDRYASNARKASGRLKRGGDAVHVALDFESAEGELAHLEVPDDTALDAFFHREWVRGLLADAVAALERECGAREFAIFRRYDLEGPDAAERPSYAGLAREFGVEVTKVTNTLHALRRRFKALVLERLRETCGSDAEYREEAAALLGVEVD